jgi:hypothetical protein
MGMGATVRFEGAEVVRESALALCCRIMGGITGSLLIVFSTEVA